MKRTFYIARNELYTLYYSPIAWIMMTLFVVLSSMDYFGILSGYAGMHERGGYNLMYVNDLTDKIIAFPGSGYFFKVISNLYIYFPLITMGLISREVSSGTIKMLYSSPVRVSEIVMGKFLAMVSFALALMVLTSLVFISMSVSLTNPDCGHMMGSLLGLFLVLCTYAAIGLFISALTSYQIVAAIITLAVFAVFSQVGNLWQGIEILRNITWYMNLSGKAADLIEGLLNTRDVCYFLVLIASFLLFAIIRIKAATESISRYKKAFRYIAVIAGAFVVGYFTSEPRLNLYADITRDKLHSITPPTQAVLKKLDDGELEITVYANLLNSFYYFQPIYQNFVKSVVWEPYIRWKPDIDLTYKYYYGVDSDSYHYKINPGKTLKEIAEKEANSYSLHEKFFLTSTEVSKLVDVGKEEFRCFFVLKYKGRTAVVRTFDDSQFWPSENEISAALNRLISTPPKIAFVTGEIERMPYSRRARDYRVVASEMGNRYALINQGYDFDTISLKDRDIPQGLTALVIADPRSSFDAGSLDKIQRYIASGGNLYIASEPDRRDVTKPIFDTLGLSLRKGLLVQSSDMYSSDCVFAYMTDTAKNLSPQWHELTLDYIKYYGDTLFRVAMGGGSAMEYKEKNGFNVQPLLVTDKALSWNRLAPISSDSLQLKVKSMPDDEKGSFATAVLLGRNINGRQQRIVAASDADYLTSPMLNGDNPARHNYAFGFWCLSLFSYGKFPANTLRPQTDDKMTVKTADVEGQKIYYYYLLPALIAIAGSVVLIRRKRK